MSSITLVSVRLPSHACCGDQLNKFGDNRALLRLCIRRLAHTARPLQPDSISWQALRLVRRTSYSIALIGCSLIRNVERRDPQRLGVAAQLYGLRALIPVGFGGGAVELEEDGSAMEAIRKGMISLFSGTASCAEIFDAGGQVGLRAASILVHWLHLRSSSIACIQYSAHLR